MREKYIKAVCEGKEIFTAKWIEVMCVDEIMQEEEKNDLVMTKIKSLGQAGWKR